METKTCVHINTVQGYLAHKKQRPPKNLQGDYALEHMVSLGGWAFSCERCTPVVINTAAMFAHLRRAEREFFIDNLLVRIHFIIQMIR